MWNWIALFLEQYSAELGSAAVLAGASAWVIRRFRKKEKTALDDETVRKLNEPRAAPPPNTIQLDLEAFTDLQRRLREEARGELAKSHGEERQRLEEKIEVLNARLRDPEEALAQQQAIIVGLEEKLARRGNEIGGDDLAAAKSALEAGNFTKARDLFETLAARTAPEVAANADAEFALGQIAEAEIRWHDAARLYGNAARLKPTFDSLYKAREYAWRAGDYPSAFRYGEDLLKVARESGTQEALASALCEHALTLKAQGRYPEAEKLYGQALEIDRATIGEAHPDYAAGLSNLAGVVRAQGRYPEAEKLCRQALEIGRATIGEAHPAYATRLNNLALVVEAQGRYPEAEGLFRQALAIGRATLGEAHPDYAVHLNNLAGVVEAQGRYPEAEGLYAQALEITSATLGKGHLDYANRLNNLAGVLAAQGRNPAAEGPYAQALAICRATLGDHHPHTQLVAHNFLDLITEHLPASPHRAEVEAVLAAGQGGDPAPNP